MHRSPLIEVQCIFVKSPKRMHPVPNYLALFHDFAVWCMFIIFSSIQATNLLSLWKACLAQFQIFFFLSVMLATLSVWTMFLKLNPGSRAVIAVHGKVSLVTHFTGLSVGLYLSWLYGMLYQTAASSSFAISTNLSCLWKTLMVPKYHSCLVTSQNSHILSFHNPI